MVIYISPSNQPNNGYVTGNTNEKEQMEKVAKQVVTMLKSYSCTPILANLNLTIKKLERPKEAKDKGADFYLAIHSNAAGSKPPCGAAGAVALYHPKSDKAKTLAANLVKNLNAICPIKSNRSASVIDGMKAFNGAGYGEIRSPMEYGIPSVLVETNFHDNPSTAKWIIENTQKIAQAIVSALADTFGLTKIQNDSVASDIQYFATGIVDDPDAPLNVRDKPDISGKLIASLPNESKVTITDKCGNGWYKVDIGGIAGFVNGDLLTNIRERKKLYCVQVGAYTDKSNAIKQTIALQSAGFNYYIKEDFNRE